ncbi:MAG: nucleotidyltransferase [Lachnospiraceae bacterium]|nr:nucleotidyltransferase [Lachnospiraceae bacterium]
MYQRKYTKICGIIAEYNPLHKGHVHHLNKAAQISGCEHRIVIMSGDFVQRGAPAICNKYERTRMALLSGADLVIELPVVYSLSSAEGFARGAVSILNSLGCVDSLCFGSECGNIDLLIEQSKKAVARSDIRKDIKSGMSFAASLGRSHSDDDGSKELILSPNNILGIEYLKALEHTGSTIKPCTIPRLGSSYNDEDLGTHTEYASAKAIRSSIMDSRTDHIAYIPEYVRNILSDTNLVYPDMFSDMLFYKLITESSNGFTSYLDVNEELSNKIKKNLHSFDSISSFTMLLKSKNLTYTRISRCLFHILLGIKKEDAFASPQYIRILGFRKGSSDILSTVKKCSTVPIITKLADAEMNPMLRKDIFSSSVYEQAAGSHLNEYRMSPVII